MALNRLQPVSLSWLDPLILLGAIALFFLGLGDFPLYEPHEGHFAGVAREMMLRGDWLTPHLNGAPYLNKPPPALLGDRPQL